MSAMEIDGNGEVFQDINHANQARKSTGKLFKGGVVEISGIYLVSHGRNASGERCGMDHEVLLANGSNFPSCRHCGTNVSFRLAKAAISLSESRVLA